MKKINVIVIAGSLLLAGALTSPAQAQSFYSNYGYNYSGNLQCNNGSSLTRFINRTSNRWLGQPVFSNSNWNGYNNINGYYNDCNNRGFVSRMIDRIF